MRAVLSAAAVLACALGVGEALAGSADIRCVQQGLQSRGFDPNGVDGVRGPGTNAAAADYLAANPKSDLPALTTAAVATWCRAFGGRGGTGAVTFAVNITGADAQPYIFHLVGLNMVSFYSSPGVSGKTVRFPVTREQANQTTGYCVVLPIMADVKFKDADGTRPKGRCTAIKGDSLPTRAVVSYEAAVFP